MPDHLPNRQRLPDPLAFHDSFKYQSYLSQAYRFTERHIVLDTHIDVPYRLEHHQDDLSQATAQGDFDYPRCRKGGLGLAFMAIYTPASYQSYQGIQGAKAFADKLIDRVESLVRHHPDQFAIPDHSQQALTQIEQGQISLALGMENGAPIEQLADLDHFHQRGIRYITLTHSKANHISDSATDTQRPWQGLSDFGKQVVKRMNQLGIMVDVSHITDTAFYQVIEHSSAPVIASHSCCRHFIPQSERNMSDDMIKLLAANKGVLFINFGSMFLTQKAYQWYIDLFKYVRQPGQSYRQYKHNNPFPHADLDDVLNHIDHVVQLVGIDHVGLGSDFDGVGDALPTHLKDVSYYPHLIAGLMARGYQHSDIEKITSLNGLRVWRAIESSAKQ